jgi:hypothetical protein
MARNVQFSNAREGVVTVDAVDAVDADGRLAARWSRMRPWFVLVVGIWVIVWPLAVHAAVTSPWAPWGEVPSPEQVDQALIKVQWSAALGIPLPALGCALAGWCRRLGTAVLLGAGTTIAVLISGLLYSFVA